MVLSVNIVDMIIDEMEMFESRAQAVEIIYKGVKRWSDKLSQNKVCSLVSFTSSKLIFSLS